MKKYTILAVILMIFILLFIASIGIYFIKRDEIKAKLFSENTQSNTTVTEQENIKPEPGVTVIKTVGTGPKRPANYTVESGYEANSGSSNGEIFIPQYGEEGLLLLVDNLKNETLKQDIKEFISSSKTKLENEQDEFEKYIEEGNIAKGKVQSKYNEEYDYYIFGPNLRKDFNIDTFQEIEKKPEIITRWSCINGYLSICFYYTYNYGKNIEYLAGDTFRNNGVYDVCCATYDLYSGKKLKFSDLFFEGEEYSTEIYELMQSEISKQQLGQFTKREFTTLPQDYEYFTINSIYFPKKNQFFSEGISIESNYSTSVPAITMQRSMEDIFIDNSSIRTKLRPWQFRYTLVQKEIFGEFFKVPVVKYPDEEIGEKINNNIEKTLEYFIANKLFNNSIDHIVHPEGKGSLRNAVRDLHICADEKSEMNPVEKGTLEWDVYYCDIYPLFRIQINPKTGDVINIGPGMKTQWYNEIKDDIPKILEEINKN